MKNTLLLLLSASIIGGFSSCRKNYNCRCVSYSGPDTFISNSPIMNEYKSEARASCEKIQSNLAVSQPSTTCTLQ